MELKKSKSKVESFTNQSRKIWLFKKNADVRALKTLYSEVTKSNESSQFSESSSHSISLSTLELYHWYSVEDLIQKKLKYDWFGK